MITVLSEVAPLVGDFLRQLRDVQLQTDRQRFEKNVERVGVVAAMELSKSLDYSDAKTKTPLGEANTKSPSEEVVVCGIFRAGLPLQRGLCQMLDQAAQGFVGAARQPETGEKVEIGVDYIAAPHLAGKVLVLVDTMLATGTSIVDSFQALVKDRGQPKKLFIVAVIASQTGVEYVQAKLPQADFIVGAIDPELNEKFYIVPGLGDAGDLLYGSKI